MQCTASPQSDNRSVGKLCQHPLAPANANFCPQCREALFPTKKTQETFSERGTRLTTTLRSPAPEVQSTTAFFVQGVLAQETQPCLFGLYVLGHGLGEDSKMGKKASERVITLVLECILSPLTQRMVKGDVGSWLASCIQLVDQCFLYDDKDTRENAHSHTMAIMSLALLVNTTVYTAAVGANHPYLIHDPVLQQSGKYSLSVAPLVREQDPPQPENLPSFLGQRQPLSVEIFQENVLAGDYLVLCSECSWALLFKDALEEQCPESSLVIHDRLPRAYTDDSQYPPSMIVVSLRTS